MKILFKNITTYSSEVYTEFLDFHNFKYDFPYKLGWTFFLIFIISTIIIQLKYQKNFFNLIIVLIAVAIIFAIKLLYPYFKVKKEYESEKISNSLSFTFRFYNKYFKILEGGKYSIIYYHSIYKAYETNNFFYLYLNKDYAFLIDKNCFSIGTSTDFSKFLKEKFRFKYKLINFPIETN